MCQIFKKSSFSQENVFHGSWVIFFSHNSIHGRHTWCKQPAHFNHLCWRLWPFIWKGHCGYLQRKACSIWTSPSQLAIEKVPQYKDLPLATQSLVESAWKLDSSPNCDAVIWVAGINGHPDDDAGIPDYHPIKYQTQLSLELNLPIILGFISPQNLNSVSDKNHWNNVDSQKSYYHEKNANSGQHVWVEKAIKLALFSKKTLQFGM